MKFCGLYSITLSVSLSTTVNGLLFQENGEIQLKPLYEDKENVPDSTDIMGMQSTTLSSFETSKQMIDVKVGTF